MNRKLHRLHIEELLMTEHLKAHPEEEILERYAMGRLDEPELDEFEDHLLQCVRCQERLDEVSEYVVLMREAAQNVLAKAPAEAAWRQWLRLDWMAMPAPALAGAFVVLAAVLAWQPWRATMPGEWQTVELATMRGGAAATTGLTGFALHLRLDVTGLDAAGATAQIVSATGAEVAETPVSLVSGKAELTYAAGLAPGQYWVRLKKAGQTMREYSLAVAAR
jgi:anti-sigma factor RsiW